MNSVTLKGANILFVGKGETPSKRQKLLMDHFKNSGVFEVTYERVSDKIQGIEIQEVIFDEVSGMGDDFQWGLPVS